MSFAQAVSAGKDLAYRLWHGTPASPRFHRRPGVTRGRPWGVNLYGFLEGALGLGQGVRLYNRALETAGVPVAGIDTGFLLGNGAPMRTGEAPYPVSLVHVNPDALFSLVHLWPKEHWQGRYLIGVWLWELARIPEAWRGYLALFDEFWAPSRFVAQALQRETGKPVIQMPYGVQVAPDPALGRDFFGLPQGDFVVLSLMDARSFAARKNPQDAIAAFFQAFSDQDAAHLALKVQNATAQELANIRALCGGSDKVTLITDALTKSQTDSLMACCDALVSLHRSEGFGLSLAEAMALGVPVVATDWSANTEFMDETCACMVTYGLVPVAGAYDGARTDALWAQPSVSCAAAHLRRLYEDPAFRGQVGQAGRGRVEQRFSVAACAGRMTARLEQIERQIQ